MCISTFMESNIEIIEKIANIIIASLTLCLAFYVFVYQKSKDKNDKKIQWFKDLIIQPKLDEVNKFYNDISLLKTECKSIELNEDEKSEIISSIKKNAADFRKNFLIFIQHLTPDLFERIQTNTDKLVDDLTQAISNDELKLNNEKTYNREIGQKIQDSYSYVLKQIFEYNG